MMRGRPWCAIVVILAEIAIIVLSLELYWTQRKLTDTEWRLLNAEFKIWSLTHN